MRPVAMRAQQVGLNEFIVYYGGEDTNVGASRIKLTVPI